jgi:SAM-dependent methyltransferase
LKKYAIKLVSKYKELGFSEFFNFIFAKLAIFSRSALSLFVPPIFVWFYKRVPFVFNQLPKLPPVYSELPRSSHGLYKLVKDFEFCTVLDVGAGGGEHSALLAENGKLVTSLDFGTSVYAKNGTPQISGNLIRIQVDFLKFITDTKYDCIWASHVLEHQADPGIFLSKCIELLNDDGVLAITVPPLKREIVGGHLTLWNAGLLLYQLVFAGLDCRDASICTYGYNVTVVVRKKLRPSIELTYDKGDIELLRRFFPDFVREPFAGDIIRWNW